MQVGGYTINKEDILSVHIKPIEIPYGNDFQVATTKIPVVKVETAYAKFVIYDKAEAGQLVDNMVMCALQGKQFFAMGQPIQGGLAIFQRFYDEHYANAEWIGVDEDIIKVYDKFTR